MPIILDFIDNYPDISLQLKVADHYIDPIRDNVDVILHITENPIEGLIAKKTRTMPLNSMCQPKLY